MDLNKNGCAFVQCIRAVRANASMSLDKRLLIAPDALMHKRNMNILLS